MHEGDHGIMDHTHEEMDKKFGKQNTPGHSGHQHEKKSLSSDLGIKIGAAIVVIVFIGIFIAYRMI